MKPKLKPPDLRTLAERNALAAENLGLVHAVIRREFRVWLKRGRGFLEYDDLLQAGCFGLLEAAKRFDPARGFKFSTPATHWIRQAIYRHVQNASRLIRVPVHRWESKRQGLDPVISLDYDFAPREGASRRPMTLADIVADEDAASPESALLRDGDVAALRRAMDDALDRRERLVVELRFLRDPPMGLLEIGEAAGCSRERVRQIQVRALVKLRARLGRP